VTQDRGVTQTDFQVAVIGGGVVGCAVLRAFALAGARAILLERGPDILSGASKANSALLHTGYDAPANSLELACVREGYDAYLDIRERLNLPLVETSALMVAWTEAELAKLPELLAQAGANEVEGVIGLDRREVLRRTPNLSPEVRGAILIPNEHVIDPWSAPLAYALQAIANGAVVRRNCEVTGGELDDGRWRLETTQGPINAEVVVNCAGLFGDMVESIVREAPFRIAPRKGQFVVFDKSAASLVETVILPVPTEATKGVLVAPTAFGNVLVGPTAEEQDDRETAAMDTATLKRLIRRAAEIVPGLAEHPVTAAYAGLRPATQFKDYQIEALAERQWITVGGIRSTGLTGALGIGAHVRRLYERNFAPLKDIANPVSTPVPNLSEHRPRPYQQGGNGEIVCHCEAVTRGEIEAALAGPLPAIDFGGLKRRTRCMMGRCQGFYCSWRVAQLAAGHIDIPVAPGDVAGDAA
jgi:glycerol-3-phosphate dehydrogenase